MTISHGWKRGLAIAWTLLIVLATLLPAPALPKPPIASGWLPNIPKDKIAHAALFAGFAYFWCLARPGKYRGILIAGVLLAAVTEVGQSIPGLQRESDFEDLAADLAGLILVLVLFQRHRDQQEARPQTTRPRAPTSVLSPGDESPTDSIVQSG